MNCIESLNERCQYFDVGPAWFGRHWMWTGRWETWTAAIFPRIWLPWPGGMLHKSQGDKFALLFYCKAILNSNTFPSCISRVLFLCGQLCMSSFILHWFFHPVLEKLLSYWQMLINCIASGFFLFIITPTELKGKVKAFTETDTGPVFWLTVIAQ